MRKQSEKSLHETGAHRHCPVFITLNLIANKWTVQMVFSLLHAPNRTMRFGALQKAMNGISQRELTKHLREFEMVGIVDRKAYAEIPPRVEYTLTELGITLCTPIEALSAWANEHGEQLQQKREAFLKKSSIASEIGSE